MSPLGLVTWKRAACARMDARTPTHPQALCCFPPPEPWATGALVEWVEAETEGTGKGAMESFKTACWVTSGKSFGWSWVISASQPLHTHIKVLCEPQQGSWVTQDHAPFPGMPGGPSPRAILCPCPAAHNKSSPSPLQPCLVPAAQLQASPPESSPTLCTEV